MEVAVGAHAVATVFLAGLIWTIQVVHYPLFPLVGADGFVAYEDAHSTRIGALIVVPWATQGVTTAWMLLSHPAGVARWLVWTAAVTAATTVVVTVAVSVPAHRRLGGGFDAVAHHRLLATNWWRTAAWTLGAAAATAIVWQHRGAA